MPAPAVLAQAAGAPLAAAGSGRLRWLGISAYEARLWVAPGFRAELFGEHAFALELHYLRTFSAEAIARRSLEEMRRAGPVGAAQAAAWEEALRRVLPDVQPGDRIAGVHRPGRGAAFVVNGVAAGEIADPGFASLFFAIWLGPATSEPRLRQALLGATP